MASRTEAQRRADRIQAFRAELAESEKELGPLLAPEARARLEGHHDATLAALAGQWDIDRTAGEQQLSLGMRIASLVGAIALVAAVVTYFYRIWGVIPTAAQLAIVSTLPIAGVLLTEFASRRERTNYFATITALLAVAGFVLALEVIAWIYNLPPSPLAVVAWGAFTLALGLAYRFSLLTFAGTLVLAVGLVGTPLHLLGHDWSPDSGRIDLYLGMGALVIAAPALRQGRLDEGTAEMVRLAGLLLAAGAILFCAGNGGLSVLPMRPGVVEGVYDVAGFGLGALALWLGLRNRWRWSARAAGAFLVLFTYIKAFDWWWELLPNYVFFLVLGAIAIAALVVLRQLRRTAQGGAS
ncbi:MAG TPA: DUF2157 domain-containing protein [Gemmatimonadales bacterium]